MEHHRADRWPNRKTSALIESESGKRAAVDYWCALDSRCQLHRSRLALERVKQLHCLRMGLKLGYYFLREQAHADSAIVVADRSLNAQDDENAGAEHTQNSLELRNN